MMPTADENGSSHREDVRHPILVSTSWEPSLPQVRPTKDTENVSRGSKVEVPLSDIQRAETRVGIEEEAKDRVTASTVSDMPQGVPEERVRQTELSVTAAPVTEAQTGLISVPRELLSELRKIIREEFLQLNKMEVKDDRTDQPRHSSSLIRSPNNTAGDPIIITSHLKDTEERKSSMASQWRDSPRHSIVRFSDETNPAASTTTTRADEASTISRGGKEVEHTAIDKRWGILFGKDGAPTKRMEHIVKGLANYIIEEFMPQRSIVITPEKMAAFYSYHRLDREAFPIAGLFRSRSKGFNEALATLYEDLGCQYFLVQADNRSRPSIPSLTPAGFMHWLFVMIEAYPDDEAKRFDKVVSALPIETDNLLDGKPERLPKQISRYLFPEKPLKRSQRIVDNALRDFKDDIEGTYTRGGGGNGSRSYSKSTPIIVTATSDRRSSMSATGSQTSRYALESPSKEARGEVIGGSSHDRDKRSASTTTSSGRDTLNYDRSRRHSMPSPLSTSGRKNSYSGGGSGGGGSSSSSSSRDVHMSSPSWTSAAAIGRMPHGGSSLSSSFRRHRSPQRNTYSQSVPAGLNRDDNKVGGGDRLRGFVNVSPTAVVSGAMAVLGPSLESSSAAATSATTSSLTSYHTGTPSSSTSKVAAAAAASAASVGGGGIGARDPRRNNSDVGAYIEKYRPGPSNESSSSSAMTALVSAYGPRDKGIILEGSSSKNINNDTSRSFKRRDVALTSIKGPTWDDYLKGSSPFTKRGDAGYHASN